MTDLTRIKELVTELSDKLAQLEEEVARLEPGARALPTGAPAAARGLAPAPDRDLPNVILPTLTDDPDSIVGGRRTLFADFQDCCAVGNEFGYFCTGTLIAPNVVVTAKHCTNADRVFLKGNNIQRSGEVIGARPIPHEDAGVDLQVLVLERDSTVAPRHVLREGETFDGTGARLVGFGTIDLGGSFGYGIKRQVDVPILSLDCNGEEDADRFGCFADYEVVAGHRGLGKDSCRGDSGGPLYVRNEEGAYCLLGATSRGARGASTVCGDGGIYVRVDRFIDWIEEVTGAEVA
jgi:hypothetical protein